MDTTFETIGLDVASERAFNHLAERAGDHGEPTRLLRRGAVLHGRCWKLGDGLEVWSVLYESGTGEIFYADCRPGFRARYMQRISPWALTEYLCGLAYRARVTDRSTRTRWQSLETAAPTRAAHENDWSLCGRIIAFKTLRNPLSGSELFWVYVDLERLKVEVLVNKRALRGSALAVGSTLTAEVWLQGHVLDERALRSRYEGIDRAYTAAQLWSALKRVN